MGSGEILFKYIVMDMDDTLLDSRKKIGNVARYELELLKRKGCKIILATGRRFRELSSYIKELELSSDDIVICCDGQYVYNCLGEEIITNHFLAWNDILLISNLTGADCMSCYTDTRDIYIEPRIIRRVKRAVYAKIQHKKISQFSNLIQAKKLINRAEKVVISINNFEKEQFENIEGLYTVHFLQNNRLEILHKDVNKYMALKLLHSMGIIDINQVLYFGDDANDIECFMNIKNCIAMGNAIELLKRNALFVTKSCDEDGVGYALKMIKTIVCSNRI